MLRVLNSSEEREFNKNAIFMLVLNGAFNLIEDKDLIKENFEKTLKKVKAKQKEIKGQISLFDVENFNKTNETLKSEILKLRGMVLNIFIKNGRNNKRCYVLKFVSNEKEFLIFVKKILKNNKTFLVLENFCELCKKSVLYINILDENFNIVLKFLKENEGKQDVLFFKKNKNSFFKNKNIKGVEIGENLICGLQKLIGKENFKIKDFYC